MSRVVQTLTLVLCAGLLLGILLLLVHIGRHGVRIELTGNVAVTGMHDRITLSMSEPVNLVMEEPAQLTASGPGGSAIPASLLLLACPECGGPMLPVRWNPWSGVIEWSCPACGKRVEKPTERD